jgi:hypothetical protein
MQGKARKRDERFDLKMRQGFQITAGASASEEEEEEEQEAGEEAEGPWMDA